MGKEGQVAGAFAGQYGGAGGRWLVCARRRPIVVARHMLAGRRGIFGRAADAAAAATFSRMRGECWRQKLAARSPRLSPSFASCGQGEVPRLRGGEMGKESGGGEGQPTRGVEVTTRGGQEQRQNTLNWGRGGGGWLRKPGGSGEEIAADRTVGTRRRRRRQRDSGYQTHCSCDGMRALGWPGEEKRAGGQ